MQLLSLIFVGVAIMSYLAVITSSTGVPLFIRSTGDVPQLSFPVVGSLNGVHWFTDNAKSTLLASRSGDVKVVWEKYHDCLTLILVSSNDSTSDVHLNYLLNLIFNAMVLLVGLQDLLKDDVENLKRELRCCYPLIDLLLSNQESMSPLTQSVEVIVNYEQKSVMDGLLTLTETIESGYGCVTVHNQMLHATDSWWQLDPVEQILLSLLPMSLSPSQCADLPVYLPKASNTIAHRLLIFHLYNGVYIIVICDAEPSLAVAQELVLKTCLPLRDKVIGLPLVVPRCLPLVISFDANVLSLCLVNLTSHRCVVSLLSSEGQENTALLSQGYQGVLDAAKRRAYLVQFYKTVVDELFPVVAEGDSVKSDTVRERIPHKVIETYCCAKSFKAYAIHKNQYNLFVLFDVNTPTYALRRLSQDILETLMARSVI